MSVNIKLFPRIHLTLIGFNTNGYRKFGGIGFSFSNPCIDLQVKEGNVNSFAFFLDGNKMEYKNPKLKNVLDSLCEKFKFKKIHCIIKSQCPQHCGFGTGTNIVLGCIESLFLINNFYFTPEQLIEFSTRGRTSGIGIQTYFNGGFVMDIGVKNQDNVFLPSNQNTNKEFSKPFFKSRMPEWNFLICVPKKISPITVEREFLFFKDKTPLSQKSVEKILYESVYGVCGSVLEEDFHAFCKSIISIQETKWKNLERKNFGSRLKKVEEFLYKAGADAIAMSSLGPSLAVFSNNLDNVENNIKNINDDLLIFRTSGNNIGRVIYD